MRKNDTLIFGQRAWQVLDFDGPHVLLRCLAGPPEEAATQTVLRSFIEGRPVYRQVSALDDVDIDKAVEESTGSISASDLGDDPRKWTEQFERVHGSRQTPDATLMLGWFAAAMEEARSLTPARILVRRPLHVKKKVAAKKPAKKKPVKR